MRIRKIKHIEPNMSKVIGINDSPNDKDVYSSNAINKILAYSTEEIKTGETWIDGKPIYRKVISIPFLPNATTEEYPHNINDIDRIISSNFVWYDTTDNKFWQNRRWSSNEIFVEYSISTTIVRIAAKGIDWSARTQDGYIVIEYTKTTD